MLQLVTLTCNHEWRRWGSTDSRASFCQIATLLACRPTNMICSSRSAFSTLGITSHKTMFDYIVASFSVSRVCHRDPWLHTQATRFKEQLTKRTAASEQRRLQQLFSTEELGDRKPTQLLRRLQQLAGDTPGLTEGTFVRKLLLQRLPANVRVVLAYTRENTSIEELAQLADRIMEVAVPPSVSNVSTQLSELHTLWAEIISLTQVVNSLRRHYCSNSRSRCRRSPSPAQWPCQPPEQSDVCWYHWKFGDSAQKCTPPCSKSGNKQASCWWWSGRVVCF